MKRSTNLSIAADIPPDLADADRTLQAYGRWATTHSGRGGRGGVTLDRMYRREADARESLEAYQRRRSHVPTEALMETADALLAQRALQRVPDRERIVLSILYVPRRLPPQAQLRLLRIPPQLSQVRHLAGLRMFLNIHRVLSYTRGT